MSQLDGYPLGTQARLKMKKSYTQKIALLALMTALIIIFCFVPITFGTISLALMILPVLIVAQVEDFKTTFALSLIMGLINYIAWFTTKAASPLAPVFQNFFVCVVSRVMIGVNAWLIRVGLEKLLLKSKLEGGKKIAAEQAIYFTSAALGTITNTLFVGAFTLLFFNGKTLSTGTAIDIKYILAWFSLNFVIEFITFAIITPPIVFALKKAHLVEDKSLNKKDILDAEVVDPQPANEIQQ